MFSDAIDRILPRLEDQSVAAEIQIKLEGLAGALKRDDSKGARELLRQVEDLMDFRSDKIHPSNLSAIRLSLRQAVHTEE